MNQQYTPETRTATLRVSRRQAVTLSAASLTAAALAAAGLAAPVRGIGAQEATPAGGDLQAAIDAILADPRYRSSRLGVYAADRETGETIFDIRGDEWFLAASTTKIFPVAAVLDAYGADYRFETPIYKAGTVSASGELDGDLILVASGDLTMGGRDTDDGEIAYSDFDHINAAAFPTFVQLTPQDPLAGLDELAEQVAESGITSVSGDVIIDDRLFPAMPKDNYILSPVWINDNLLDLSLTAGEAGEAATLEWRPMSAAYQVEANVQTVAAGGALEVSVSSPAPGQIVVEGQVPADLASWTQIFQVEDPRAHARTLLIEALERAGVAVTATPTGVNPIELLPAQGSYAEEDRAALLVSLPFSENLKLIQKTSHNQHADMLIFMLALHSGSTSYDDGMVGIRPILEQASIDPTLVSLSDGRGNEYTDLFSPRTVTELLAYMATRPDFPTFFDALPVLGVNGTEATTVPADSPVAGKASAKSGLTVAGDTMNERALVMTRSLAGYMTGRSGRELVFGIYLNSVPLASLDEVLTVITEHGAIAEAIYERA